MAPTPRPKKIRNQAVVIRILDKLLTKEPYSADDMAYELAIAYKTAKKYLKELWILDIVYICSWDRKYNYSVPVYKWGTGEDKEKPESYSKLEIAKRHRLKYRDAINAKRREKRREDKRRNSLSV